MRRVSTTLGVAALFAVSAAVVSLVPNANADMSTSPSAKEGGPEACPQPKPQIMPRPAPTSTSTSGSGTGPATRNWQRPGPGKHA
ncbi:MAG: hypothetical protein ACLQVI_33080 [Polyangiaceae bacterium]